MLLQISGWFIVIGSASLLVILTFFFLLFLQNSRRKFHHQQELQMIQTRFEQEILLAQLEIQEQTMKNISQEIHDNIGQTLSLVKLNLNTIDIQKQDIVPQKIANSKELVTKAIADLRSLSKSLHTDSILSVGLTKAIEFELRLIDKTGVYQTELKISGDPVSLDPQKELILFRIMQEAMNNIIKHAKATSISITMEYADKILVLSIEDNGCGFEMQAETGNRDLGIGLRSMQNRAQLINSKFVIQSHPSSGTRIQITVPV